MKIMIVTDQFPPTVKGGAEISLLALLNEVRKLRKDIQFKIIVLSEDINKPATYEFAGYRVTKIPITNAWPTSATRYQRSFSSLGRLGNKLRLVTTGVDYILMGKPTELIDRVKLFWLFFKMRRRGVLGHFPMIDKDFLAYVKKQRHIQKIYEVEKPDLIHADNYRAILTTSIIKKTSTPTVAVVRDNRFFCSKKQQSAHIKGKECQNCSFGCVTKPGNRKGQVISEMNKSLTIRQRALMSFQTVIVTSNFLANQMVKIGVQKPIVKIGNAPGIPFETIDRTKRTGPINILVVGMVNENKGQIVLPEIMAYLSSHGIDYTMTIAGRGQMIQKIIHRAEEKGVVQNLETPGFLSRKDLFHAYRNSDLVIAPGVWPEPFGRVPLEAAAFQLPIIAYAKGGYTETIINKKTGLLIEPNDLDKFCGAVKELCLNKKKRLEMGNAAQTHIQKNFDQSVFAKRYIETWEQLSSGSEAPFSRLAAPSSPSPNSRSLDFLLVSVDFFPSIGGISLMTHELANAFVEKGYNVGVLAPEGSFIPGSYAAKYHFIEDKKSYPKSKCGPAWALKERHHLIGRIKYYHNQLKFKRVLVLHTHYYGPAFTSHDFNGLFSVGQIYHGFEINELLGWKRKWTSFKQRLIGEAPTHFQLTRQAACDADITFTNSHYTRDLVKRFQSKTNPIVIGCGAPENAIKYMHASKDNKISSFKKKARIPEDAFTIGMLGRLTPSKNVDLLIESLVNLPNTYALILGEGKEYKRLSQLAIDLNVDERVCFYGHITEDEKYQALNSLDALCLISSEKETGQTEGFGIVMLEATAAGTPVIASNNGGITEFAKHEQTALVIKPNSVHALKNAIQALQKDPSLSEQLVSNAQLSVNTDFNWPSIVDKIVKAW